MTDQPIIIQELDSHTKNKQKWLSHSEKQFFQVLDTVESYDSLSNQIRVLHQDAMISLASLKFTNTNNISINSHRCLPAFLTLNQSGQLQEGYVPFTKTIDQDKYYEQFQEQNYIQQQCLSKQQNSQQKTSRNIYKQNELLYRFNVMNEPSKVLLAASQFQELLKKLLSSIQTKKQVEKQLSTRQRLLKE